MEMYVGGREDEYWCAKNSMGYSWMVDTAAPSVDMNSPIRTCQAACPDRGWVLIFDAEK